VKPDIVAAGNRVVAYQATGSTLATQYPGNRPLVSSIVVGGANTASPYFFEMSGTSMAAPLVSGAAALLVQKDPTLTPDQVKARLMRTAWRGFTKTTNVYDAVTAQTYTANHDIFTIGDGQLDIWAAFNDTNKGSGTAASPSLVYNATNKTAL